MALDDTAWDLPRDLDAASWEHMAPITPRAYLCRYTPEPPRIDGRLDDAAWADAEWSEPFVDIEGDRRAAPRFETRVAMRWDDEHLYIAARLEEPHVWGTLTERNSVLFQDNDFEVFIDPDGDNHNYYELEINALNTIWELTMQKPYRDGGPAVSPTNIEGLQSAVHVEGTLNDPRDVDSGWTVELAIPWSGLAPYSPIDVPPAEGEQWRMNFSRVEWEHALVDGSTYAKLPNVPEQNWVWSPQGVVDMHRPERWGYVQFTRSHSGKGVLRSDDMLPYRDALMGVYYAQRRFHSKEARWAGTLEELDVAAVDPRLLAEVALSVSSAGWQARIRVGPDGGVLPAQGAPDREHERSEEQGGTGGYEPNHGGGLSTDRREPEAVYDHARRDHAPAQIRILQIDHEARLTCAT